MNNRRYFRRNFQACILLENHLNRIVLMRYLILSLFIGAVTFTASDAVAADIKLLYFYDKGCRWCEVMDDILRDPSIREILGRNTDILRIDVRGREGVVWMNMTGKELAERYKIRGTPTVIFLSAGKEVLRVPGATTKNDFKDLICSYVIGVNNMECLLRGTTLLWMGKMADIKNKPQRGCLTALCGKEVTL